MAFCPRVLVGFNKTCAQQQIAERVDLKKRHKPESNNSMPSMWVRRKDGKKLWKKKNFSKCFQSDQNSLPATENEMEEWIESS